MSRKQQSLSKKLVLAMALALGATNVATADGVNADNSMSRLSGDGYAYFNQPMASNAVAGAAWRVGHPNGLTEHELQAAGSSPLSASASQLDNPNPLFASAPADPSWRQSHPNGLTERELQAVGASSLASWQDGSVAGAAIAPRSVAQSPSKAASLSRGATKTDANLPSWTFGE